MGTVLVTGGAGYLGCVLVPKLMDKHSVIVFDALWFGREAIDQATAGGNVEIIEGDIRDDAAVDALLANHDIDTVIHLAAVSNDPCSELDADLTRSVNLEATKELMRKAKESGVRRFINASSASVYGIKSEENVTEDLPLDPLTLYARYKAVTEQYLRTLMDEDFECFSVRAATVCGYSPRLRLDLTINILTYHALTKGEIRVFGGEQLRPNVHIQDLTDLYASLVDMDREQIDGKSLNIVTANSSVLGLAEMIRDRLPEPPSIKIVPTEDKRSYHLSGARAAAELGFTPSHELAETIDELRSAFADGRIPDPDHYRHRNVEVMKRHPERTKYP
jgi:nucleoside-diphosphate-sugar epimerase